MKYQPGDPFGSVQNHHQSTAHGVQNFIRGTFDHTTRFHSVKYSVQHLCAMVSHWQVQSHAGTIVSRAGSYAVAMCTVLFRDGVVMAIRDNGSDHRAGTIILQAENFARKPGFACITLLLGRCAIEIQSELRVVRRRTPFPLVAIIHWQPA